jgi:hypothetical protein
MTTDHGPQRQPARTDLGAKLREIRERIVAVEHERPVLFDTQDMVDEITRLRAENERLRRGPLPEEEQQWAIAHAVMADKIAHLRTRIGEAIDFLTEFVEIPDGYWTDGDLRKDAKAWLADVKGNSDA